MNVVANPHAFASSSSTPRVLRHGMQQQIGPRRPMTVMDRENSLATARRSWPDIDTLVHGVGRASAVPPRRRRSISCVVQVQQPVAAGRAEHLMHVVGGDRRCTNDSSCSSSDWLSRIEPAARRASTCRALSSASTPSAWTICASRSTMLVAATSGEVEPLAAREDRNGDLRRLGRAEDELHMLGWLFQRLQQGVEGLLGEHVDFVDDVDLEPRATGPHT